MKKTEMWRNKTCVGTLFLVDNIIIVNLNRYWEVMVVLVVRRAASYVPTTGMASPYVPTRESASRYVPTRIHYVPTRETTTRYVLTRSRYVPTRESASRYMLTRRTLSRFGTECSLHRSPVPGEELGFPYFFCDFYTGVLKLSRVVMF